MKNAGYSMKLCRMIWNCLRDSSSYVKIDDKYPTSRILKAGVPQGSLLGLLLYNIHDIPKNLRNLLTLSADDTFS